MFQKTLNGNLTLYEEDEVNKSLQIISNRVRKYKMQLFPYFKDFDRVRLSNFEIFDKIK